MIYLTYQFPYRLYKQIWNGSSGNYVIDMDISPRNSPATLSIRGPVIDEWEMEHVKASVSATSKDQCSLDFGGVTNEKLPNSPGGYIILKHE